MNRLQLSDPMASHHHTSGDTNAGAVIRRHSRSFWIASRLLPTRVRGSVHALYAWCRTVDDAVDKAADKEDAERILNELDDDLDRIWQRQTPLHSASFWIEPLIVDRRIDVKHAKDLIVGMRMDLHSFVVTNPVDLHRYCYHAAGTVGLMMTQLMGVKDPVADRYAIALGVAMQLTNIARDVREDAECGRSYLPGIADPLSQPPPVVRSAVKVILEDAERKYEVAMAGLKLLPRDCRFAIRIALSLYREIGRQIQRNGYEVLSGRTWIRKSRLMLVLAVTSIRFIPQYFQETTMRDTKISQVSTVGQAKHVVYLGLSLTAIMATALFVMVFMNPKDESYSYLPLVYSGASLFAAIVFNRLAASKVFESTGLMSLTAPSVSRSE
ncbi:MAG TPA: hypothetical protein DDZ51_20100 [Planctomycetaceae bacterium]|nr:hypothetical protein [Planctomycetaceae bacterium]